MGFLRIRHRWLAAVLTLVVVSWSCAGSRGPLADNPTAPLPPPEAVVEIESVQVSPPSEVELSQTAATVGREFEQIKQSVPAEESSAAGESAELERGEQPEAPPPTDIDQPAVDPEEMALLDELTDEAIPEQTAPLSDEERLRQTESELPLVLNPQVEKLISYFTKTRRGMGTMRASLGRGDAYREMIDRVLDEEDVPKEIFYLAMAESGFRPKARSYAYATGMWQFVSATGKQYGLKQDRYVDLRYAVERATRASAKHLKDLYIEFEDWCLVMAAYNCGPNCVARAIKRGGTRDYWELSRRRLLPSQTRNYVPIILAMTYVGKNLDLFDLGEIDLAPTIELDSVETATEISFALIADITGVSTNAVKDLNPALLRSATPPYAYNLNLPKGTREQFLKDIAAVPADKRLNWRRHEPKAGETLAAVAKRFSVKTEELAALNNLEPEASLEGLRLTVPTTTAIASYRHYGGGRAGGLLEPGTGRYRIARGDTLGGIAERFGATTAKLRAWNGLTSTRIRAGRYLIVRPEGVGEQAASSGSAPAGRYRVRSGDTLGRIAGRYGVSVSQLRSWNGIGGSTIQVGQSLKVPGQASTTTARGASASIPAKAQAPAGPGQYRIRNGDSLIAISQRFGVSVDDLRKWNKMRGSRITAGKYLTVRPPSSRGTRRTAAAAPQPAPTPSRGTGTVRYKVRSGDTLGHIAETYNVTSSKLRAWNGIRGSRISIGQSLVIKEQPTSTSTAARKPTTTVAAATPARRPATQPTPKRQGAPRPTSSTPATYTVHSGDTLGHIAEKFGVRSSDLRNWNGLRGSRINVGQKLSLRAPNLSNGRYQIRRGDTLDVIARRFEVSVTELKQWNGLRSSRIAAGDYLVVRQSGS
jgi:membrane-bound lytic murein transglycosylase D